MAAFLIPGCLAAAQISAQEPAQAFTVVKAGGKGWRFVVVINLGQNDFGHPNSRGEPFLADFSTKYTALVRNIRGLYPQACIVCAIGGMTAYRDSPDLREAFDRAVAELRAGDAGIYKYVFQACSANHPRVETHIRMAEELTAFLRENVLGG